MKAIFGRDERFFIYMEADTESNFANLYDDLNLGI